MVAQKLLGIGRVTLAETIESSGHRTPTSILSSPLIRAHEQPMDGHGDLNGPDLDS